MIEILLIIFATWLICISLLLSTSEAKTNSRRFKKFVEEEIKKLSDYEVHHGFKPIIFSNPGIKKS